MPAYMSSVICDDSIFPHHEVPTDDRAYLRQKVLQMTVDSSCAYFYPCVYPILNSAIDPSDPKPGIRCSYERFKQDQVNFMVLYSCKIVNLDLCCRKWPSNVYMAWSIMRGFRGGESTKGQF